MSESKCHCGGDGWMWDINQKIPCDICQPILYETHLGMHQRINTAVAERDRALRERDDIKFDFNEIKADFEKCYDVAMMASSYWPELSGSWTGTVSERLQRTFAAEHEAREAAEVECDALREENARTERLRTCGQHPLLGDVTQQGSRACGRVLSVGDLYRCADCQTAFCRECIRRHFADETPEAREMMRRAEERARLDAEPATEKEGDRE